MGASDLRVTVDGVKLRCVLDPALVLGQACGLKLALGLTRVFETWLPRSFWQVLDASELLGASDPPESGLHPLALSDWTALRDGTDAGSWTLRWVGDNLAESQLRGSASDDSLVERFEWHAEALQAHQARPNGRGWCQGFDPVASAHDALALSAALDGALILCRAPDAHAEPGPVQALNRLTPAPELLAEDDGSLMGAERAFVRQAIAAAGLAALLQSVEHACVVHALTLPPAADASNDDTQDPWQRSRAWWYRL